MSINPTHSGSSGGVFFDIEKMILFVRKRQIRYSSMLYFIRWTMVLFAYSHDASSYITQSPATRLLIVRYLFRHDMLQGYAALFLKSEKWGDEVE